MKESFKLLSKSNPKIKVGDSVKLNDGSALTVATHPDKTFYIVDAHPWLTGTDKSLRDIVMKVIEINREFVCINNALAMRQDIALEYNQVIFRTSSAHVAVVEQPKPSLADPTIMPIMLLLLDIVESEPEEGKPTVDEVIDMINNARKSGTSKQREEYEKMNQLHGHVVCFREKMQEYIDKKYKEITGLNSPIELRIAFDGFKFDKKFWGYNLSDTVKLEFGDPNKQYFSIEFKINLNNGAITSDMFISFKYEQGINTYRNTFRNIGSADTALDFASDVIKMHLITTSVLDKELEEKLRNFVAVGKQQ